MARKGGLFKMRKGRVRITNELIAQALKFSPGWIIEEIKPTERSGESEMLISGYDFPETDSDKDAKDVKLICHKEDINWEVKEGA